MLIITKHVCACTCPSLLQSRRVTCQIYRTLQGVIGELCIDPRFRYTAVVPNGIGIIHTIHFLKAQNIPLAFQGFCLASSCHRY